MKQKKRVVVHSAGMDSVDRDGKAMILKQLHRDAADFLCLLTQWHQSHHPLQNSRPKNDLLAKQGHPSKQRCKSGYLTRVQALRASKHEEMGP